MSSKKFFLQQNPDYVVVYGDTESTLPATLTAKKLSISVVHIEAGLRQSPKTMPEEVNRVLTYHRSKVLFTSSKVSIMIWIYREFMKTVIMLVT